MGYVLDTLRSDQRLAGWLAGLEAQNGAEVGIVLPAADGLPAILLDLAVPHEDINELVSLRDVMAGDADLRWLLDGCTRTVVGNIGAVAQGVELPLLPTDLGTIGRSFYVFVFVAALPEVRRYHHERGIPPDVSRRTLADLGRAMALHRRRFGTVGLHLPFWLELHFRGLLYQLGRLQFQRARLGTRTGNAIAAAGMSLGPGDPSLEIHIPDFSGPLTPSACGQALDRARAFFPRHFADETYGVAGCHSWLLDPQLGEYLPGSSNIMRFQSLFKLAYQPTEPDDSGPVGFVFGDPGLAVGSLPRRTTLERAIADHLTSGGHWYGGNGWLEL